VEISEENETAPEVVKSILEVVQVPVEIK